MKLKLLTVLEIIYFFRTKSRLLFFYKQTNLSGRLQIPYKKKQIRRLDQNKNSFISNV